MLCGDVNRIFILIPSNTVSFLFLSLGAQENCINPEQGIYTWPCSLPISGGDTHASPFDHDK
jgi:hypothetical protein